MGEPGLYPNDSNDQSTQHQKPVKPVDPSITVRSVYFLAPSCEPEIPIVGHDPLALIEEVSPFLNWSSTWYCFSKDLIADFRLLAQLVDVSSLLLQRYPFCHVTIRPVHPVQPDSLGSLYDCYERLMAFVKPFQHHAYQVQGVARLLIFPLMFVQDAIQYEQASRVATYTNKSFMLPSVILTKSLSEIFGCTAASENTPWVRHYIADREEFDPLDIVCMLHDEEVLETLRNEPLHRIEDFFSIKQFSIIMTSSGTIGTPMTTNSLPMRGVHIAGRLSMKEALTHLATKCIEENSCVIFIKEMLDRIEHSASAPNDFTTHAQISYTVATYLQSQGLWKEALSELERAGRLHPPLKNNQDIWLRMGICTYQLGNYHEAAQALTTAIQIDPLAPEPLYYLALCEYAWRDYIRATDILDQALTLNPSSSLRHDIWLYKGISHYFLAEYDEVIASLTNVIDAGTPDSVTYFYLGLAWLGKKNITEALSHLHKSLNLNPSPNDIFSILFYIAYCYKERNSYSDALRFLDKAAKLDENNYDLYNLKGFCHFKLKEYDQAIEALTKAISLRPNSGLDYASIGSCLREKGDVSGAIRMYQKALELDPSLSFASENLAKLRKDSCGSRRVVK